MAKKLPTPIQTAVAALGGQADFARALKLNAGLVSQWVRRKRPVAAQHCIPIETATGGAVTRYQLRPDVFGAQPVEQAA
jgi:DNA-binding transcriptional regulator YdaS (Cro superfamily)